MKSGSLSICKEVHRLKFLSIPWLIKSWTRCTFLEFPRYWYSFSAAGSFVKSTFKFALRLGIRLGFSFSAEKNTLHRYKSLNNTLKSLRIFSKNRARTLYRNNVNKENIEWIIIVKPHFSFYDILFCIKIIVISYV